MKKRRVVLVTGMSGAGKTSAMAVLEDMGYHCIDRLPVFLIDEFISDVFSGKKADFENIALSVTAKDFNMFHKKFKNTDAEVIVLFLDASKEQLLLRYKYNRRNHPLIVSGHANGLEEAIVAEIDEFSSIKSYATIIIDTTFLTMQNLTSRIQRFFSASDAKTLTLSLISFGYRKGLPRDADLVFDVRFLNNPYWEVSLREKSGNDAAVYSYVIEDEKTKPFLEHLKAFLDYALVQYELESKHLLTVAIGCTGGQHRSVSIANWIHKTYKNKYNTVVDHRDAVEEVVS